MILKTDNITMQFGGVTAVNLLNIEINEHEIVALIGRPGISKSIVLFWEIRHITPQIV